MASRVNWCLAAERTLQGTVSVFDTLIDVGPALVSFIRIVLTKHLYVLILNQSLLRSINTIAITLIS